MVLLADMASLPYVSLGKLSGIDFCKSTNEFKYGSSCGYGIVTAPLRELSGTEFYTLSDTTHSSTHLHTDQSHCHT